MKKILLASLSALLVTFLALPVVAGAATLNFGENVSEKRQEIRDNLYAAGGNVTIASVVFGDITVAGGTITISENVSDDVMAGGGTVTLLGEIGGDVRVAGGNITISKNIGGDLLIGAGAANILPGVNISKDLIAGIGAGTIDGTILGNARIMGGDITINGNIKGDASITAEERLTFSKDARIEGNLTYSAPEKIEIPEGVVAGTITFEERGGVSKEQFAAGLIALIGVFFLFKMLCFIVIALLLIFLLPSLTKEITERAITGAPKELVRGFLVAIALPVLSILAVVSIIGMVVGGLSILLTATLFLIASSLSGIIFGTFLAHTFFKSQNHANWKHALWGVVTLQLIGIVPIVGWIIKSLVFLIALGSSSYYLYRRITSKENIGQE